MRSGPRNGKPRSAGGEAGGIWLVLYLNPKKRGSLEQQLLAIAERLRAADVPLTCVFSRPPPAWYAAELHARGVDARAMDYTRPLAAAASLYGELRRARPRLVHFHFFRASSPLVLAARAAGARVIVNDHVSLTPGVRGAVGEALKRTRDRLVNPWIDTRLAVSRFVAETVVRYEHVDRRRVRVIENGIDIERFAQARPDGIREELGLGDRPLVACVSRLAREKGVETAVRAVRHFAADAVLAMVGDGPLEAELKRLAGELGVRERVRFLGLRNDVERVLAAAEVSIVPSEWDEAFGQAVVESMAAGKGIVVTASGAMPEIVGASGLVAEKRNPLGLARAVNKLLLDPALRRAMGAAALERARARYALDRWADRMVALYDGATTRRARPAEENACASPSPTP